MVVNVPIVVEYLKLRSLADLEREHGVKYRRDKAFTKITLNYDQLMAKSGDRLAGQCRGLILSPLGDSLSHPDWENVRFGDSTVVAWPMNRFYNVGDPSAELVSWDDSGLTVFEKLDGTCTILYWDDKKREWHVGTRGVPEADMPMNEDGLTFRELFEMAVKATTNASFDALTKKLNKHITYVFELTAPQNRIVVEYSTPMIHLLTARDLKTGLELDNVSIQDVPRCPTLKVPSTLDELISFVNEMSPKHYEGVVLCDGAFRRLKVKSLAYVLSSRAVDMLRTGSIDLIASILDGTIDDVLPNVSDEIKEKILKIVDAIASYDQLVRRTFTDIRYQVGDDKKAFAELAKTSGVWTAPLFAINAGKAKSFIDWAQSAANTRSVCRQIRDNIVKSYDYVGSTSVAAMQIPVSDG